MNKVYILSDNFSAEELSQALGEQMKNNSEIHLELEKQPGGTMALNPVELVTIMNAGVPYIAILVAIIGGLFTVYNKKLENEGKKIENEGKKIENEAKKAAAVIEIKTIEGTEIKVAQDTNPTELAGLLAILEGKKLKTIAIVNS